MELVNKLRGSFVYQIVKLALQHETETDLWNGITFKD